jgi:outer membrane protein TolC
MRFEWLGLAAALGWVIPVGGWAQGEAPPLEPAPPGTEVALPQQGTLSLSLRDAIATAIEKNTDLEVVRYDPEIADLTHKAAWGVYEPEYYGVADHSDSSLPTAQVFQGFGFLLDKETTGATGLRGMVPMLGWSYDLGYSGSKVETTSTIASLNPEYRSNVTFAFNAPLLRGFLFNEPWVAVRLTGEGSAIAYEDFRRQLMDLVRNTEDGYWFLAAAARELEVARKSLETSRALLKQTQAQYEVGVVSRVEVTEAEAGVAQREFLLITTENIYRTRQDALADLVFGPALTPTTSAEIITSDSPENYQPLQIDPSVATEKAMANRPELLTALRQLEQQRIRLQFARNQRLPQLDLVASYGTHGLSGVGQAINFGSIVIPAPPGVPDQYGDTHDQLFQGDDSRSWTAGARVSIPIVNTSARSRVRISELEYHKSETLVTREQQAIVSEVRNAVRDLDSAIQGIEAAERRRLAAVEQHRAEQIRLEHGESTPFDVLQREEDLVEAESQKIAALRVYHSSVAALDRAQGTILEDRGVQVDAAMGMR